MTLRGCLSAWRGTIESMFEESEAAARSLVARIGDRARAQNRATAEMLVSIGHLFRLRLREFGECANWACDTTDAVTAEVAAALRISQGLSANHLSNARAMRDDLPQLATVFVAGDIDYLMFQTLVYRTGLITDPEAKADVDAELAAKIPRWPSLSRGQIAARVDRIVARHDRDGVRRRQKKSDDRIIEIWDSGDGLSEIRGFLRNIDGHALDARLDALADTVCDADPRTKVHRRADAMGALAAGADRLVCECDSENCPASDKPPATAVVIQVIAEQATIDGVCDVPGFATVGDELLPPELVRELARSAKLVPLVHPGDAAPECGYAPSRALADFVRCRDLTCRFPGCDRPAICCDLDHTVAFGEGGTTHASNLKCLCRQHHLSKTFWAWRDEQLRDGTVIWTSPSGERYVTTPGSALLFPSLCRPTGELEHVPRADDRGGERTAMMPKRRMTRAQNRARRIADERRLNREDREVHIAKKRWERALLMATDEPPPF